MKTIYLRIKTSGEPKVIQAGDDIREGEKLYQVREARTALDAKCLYALYSHAQDMTDDDLDAMLEKDAATFVKLKQALKRVSVVYE